MNRFPESTQEWLQADGVGGFASGTSTGIRTRRYHALLLTATTPPTGRMVLVNGFDAWIETPAGRFELTSQYYAPGVVGGDGAQRVEQFRADPWPRWIFKCEDGTRVEQEIVLARGSGVTQVRWRLPGQSNGVRLCVRPFLSGRDYHALHKQNPVFRFEPERKSECVIWTPYAGVPAVVAVSNGQYEHLPHWYLNFRYAEEAARGLDDTEDLAAPGVFNFDLARGEAVLMFATPEAPALLRKRDIPAAKFAALIREDERARRSAFAAPFHRAAESYIVNGRQGKTIIAGYPWFTDWGRDTFIAVRGLCLATGRFAEARDILMAWSAAVSQGMLPNRFPDHGAEPEYNSVDASLWYVIAVCELMAACTGGDFLSSSQRETLRHAVLAIVEGYARGARYGIKMDDDGLLLSGERGMQLTWMDAKVGEWVVTPRAGKPVEVQALWLNALHLVGEFAPQWRQPFERGLNAFRSKFWNDRLGCLYDVIDVNHHAGDVDAAFRPNQIFAVGGLPLQLIEAERARRVVAAVEEKLLTPLGLRSLARGEAGYSPRCEGGVLQRDGAYHQGTVWPWLIGPFVQAWVRVRSDTLEARRMAREKFLNPLVTHLNEAGLGHVSEIADAEPPHTPRGCPFQAWSLGEVLRLDQVILADKPASPKRKSSPASVPARAGNSVTGKTSGSRVQAVNRV